MSRFRFSLAIAGLATCVFSSTGLYTIGGDTLLDLDCDLNDYSLAVNASTSTDAPSAQVYVTGVSTEWTFDCGEACSLDGGSDFEETSHAYASLFTVDVGENYEQYASISASANSDHWTDGEWYSDETSSNDSAYHECGGGS